MDIKILIAPNGYKGPYSPVQDIKFLIAPKGFIGPDSFQGI